MRVDELIHHLQANHQPSDQIVVVWYDKAYATNALEPILLANKEIVEQAWQEVTDKAQELLDDYVGFTQAGAEISELLREHLMTLLLKEMNNA